MVVPKAGVLYTKNNKIKATMLGREIIKICFYKNLKFWQKFFAFFLNFSITVNFKIFQEFFFGTVFDFFAFSPLNRQSNNDSVNGILCFLPTNQ